jgi:uncharacterized hydrophobic protein (TIGR00271 family)
MAGFREHLHGGPVDAEEIVRVREAILFEEPERQRRLTRFYILLILAAAIATFGLLADSVATVIGAMIVAPLMLPIMGVAFGVALGDRTIIRSSLTTSILGILTAIAVGFLLTWGMRSLIFVEANTQILVRTTPRLIDLLAALATGLAGAFAIGRKDVSDTLPGVAIAISLVPPLANVGILLAAGRPDLAMGSLLLFVTNYLAILLTGALMFTVMGFPVAYRARYSPRSKYTAVAIAAVLLALIIVPLAGASYATIRSSVREQLAAGAAGAWLADHDYRVVSITAGIDEVRIVITGEGVLPSQRELQDALGGKLAGTPIIIEVVPQTRIRLESAAPGSQ